jgi:signal-transduction protein with cAMP-binding, CBS, and nucleotidyltransferase domain
VAATAAALAIALDPARGTLLAQALEQGGKPTWVRQTAERLRSLEGGLTLSALPELEKRVVLATSDFFRRTWADTLDALAEQAEIRRYGAGDLITEAGDTCRELLLLMEGAAQVNRHDGDRIWKEQMRPGQVLDELEVLTHSASESTIVAETAGTRVLAVPVDSFDATLERDPDFARRVLEMETLQLQRLTRGAAGPGRP